MHFSLYDVSTLSSINEAYNKAKITSSQPATHVIKKTEVATPSQTPQARFRSPVELSFQTFGMSGQVNIGYRVNAGFILPSGPEAAFNFIESFQINMFLGGFQGKNQQIFVLGIEAETISGRYLSSRNAISLTLTILTNISFPNFIRSFIPLSSDNYKLLSRYNLLTTNSVMFGIGRENLVPTDRIRLAKIFIQFSFYLESSLHLYLRFSKIYPYDQGFTG